MKEGWESKTVEEICVPDSPACYGIVQPGPDVKGGVPYVRPVEIVGDVIQVNQLRRTSQEIAQKYRRSALQGGDVLLTIVGTIGKVAIVPEELAGANLTQSSARIRPQENVIQAHFLAYALRSPQLRQQFESFRMGTAVTRLNVAHVRKLTIPVPPLPEQRRIVAILDEAFEGIAAAKANAERNLKNAREVFEAELEFTFSNNDGESSSLADVCSIESSLVDPRDPKYQQCLHVGGANMVSGTGELIDLQTAEDEGLISGKFLFEEDVVLYSKIRPYLRKVARPDFCGLCSADVYPLTPKPGAINSDYLYYLLASPQFTAYAVQGSARAGMPKVNRNHLFAYRFALPSLERQFNCTNRLDVIGEQSQSVVDVARRKIAALDELKASLLHQAFTGNL